MPDEEEALFMGRDQDGVVRIRANLHSHSTHSDGQYSLEELSQFAEKHCTNIAVTDHNVFAWRHKWLPGLIPGMELTSREGIDFVTWGTQKEMHRLFEDIRPYRAKRNPLFQPLHLSATEVIAAVRERVPFILHPHYGSVDGLSTIPPDEQQPLLASTHTFAFLEENALLSEQKNALANHVALEWKIPFIATGDTHRDEKQYVSTYTEMPFVLLVNGPMPLVHRFLKTLHTSFHNNVLRPTSTMEKVQTGTQVIVRNGFSPIVRFCLRVAERCMGIRPKAAMKNVPRPLL